MEARAQGKGETHLGLQLTVSSAASAHALTSSWNSEFTPGNPANRTSHVGSSTLVWHEPDSNAMFDLAHHLQSSSDMHLEVLLAAVM